MNPAGILQAAEPLLVYLAAVNILLFWLMGLDKHRARHGEWRIPESALFTLCIIGGSLGGVLGMRLFHHKTKHRAFALGFPLLLALHILLLLAAAYLHLSA